jgi:hypothetical protein
MMTVINWIATNYPIGSIINAPHPRNNKMEKCTVTGHGVDNVTHPLEAGPTEITVEFSDGTKFKIDRCYLNEAGGGV